MDTLMLLIEKAREIQRTAISNIIKETKLPAYLIEGVLLEALSEIRAQKVTEVIVNMRSQSIDADCSKGDGTDE